MLSRSMVGMERGVLGWVIILDWSLLLYIYIPQLSLGASAWRAALEDRVVCQDGRFRGLAGY
jgi:hypothetical protein